MRGDFLPQARHNSIGVILVLPANYVGKHAGKETDGKRKQNCSEALPENRREFVSKESQYASEPRRFAAVYGSMRSGDQVIQVVDKSLVLDLFPGNCEIRGRAPVKAAELPDLFAGKPPQPQPRRCSSDQFFQARPLV